MINYDDILQRIKSIYHSCTAQEKLYMRRILQEIADYGESPTYRDIWLADYKEIPVDKKTFLTHPDYLGNSNNNGKSIYPAWMDVMLELERTGNQYTEIVFTGATRTGKTSTAVSDAAYHLYRLMCLRNPQEYFGLKSVTAMSIFFFNITQTLAKGVAFREFNTTLSVSPWFLNNGHFTKSESNPTYVPDGGCIEVSYGSDFSHALGKATYCVVGNTEILTKDGYVKIEDLSGGKHLLGQYVDGKIEFVETEVKCTGHVRDTISIELRDGTIIEGTPNHKVLLSNGRYVCLKHVKLSDSLFAIRGKTKNVVRVESIGKVYYPEAIPVYDVINALPAHNFVIRGNRYNHVLHNCVVFDECNFASAGIKDIKKAKQRMKEKYDTLVARVTGTFVKNGEVFGRLYVISSKRNDSDFMEEYVQSQKEAGNPHMYIFDKPQWEVWPASKYSSDKKFLIALGGRRLRSYVIPDNQMDKQSLEDIQKQGYSLLEVPEDNKVRFLSDFDVALRDIAGISIPGSLSYISQEIISACIGNRKNPFFSEVIQVGYKDKYTIEEFFHEEVVSEHSKKWPMFIHLDLSLTTDRSGISGVSISGRRDQDVDGRVMSEITFSHMFSVAVEAPKGDKIAYNKVVQFLLWLRRKGFNIQGVSRDQYQSEYLAQLLDAQGFSTDKISLDRTPEGYNAFRSVMLEERIDLLDVDLLQDELIHLQRDSFSGAIDHPEGGSKDVSDSVAGAVWNAILKNPGVPVQPASVASAIAHVNGPRNVRGSTLPPMFNNMKIRR